MLQKFDLLVQESTSSCSLFLILRVGTSLCTQRFPLKTVLFYIFSYLLLPLCFDSQGELIVLIRTLVNWQIEEAFVIFWISLAQKFIQLIVQLTELRVPA